MGYSNIIDSLVDNRSVISESGLLRDNKQILPNSSRLEKCDIFTGRNCHSDTISNYIKSGWKLPKTIDIDKQFKFREHSGYFITMNNW